MVMVGEFSVLSCELSVGAGDMPGVASAPGAGGAVAGLTALSASAVGAEGSAAGFAGSAAAGVVGFSMSVIIWASPLSARGKMGASGPSLVPGSNPPHFKSFSLPLRAASSMLPRPSCRQTEAVA